MLQNICLAQASAREVYVVNVSGTVDPGMAAFIKRALGVPLTIQIPILFLKWIPSADVSIPHYRS